MLKVLVAEDDVILADILEDYLTSQGYEVCGLASTVDEAVMLADLHKPDLAVFDFRLGKEGYSTDIRPRLKDKTTMSILYVSGDPLQARLTKADGEAYIQKPYGMKDLVSSLRILKQISLHGRTGFFIPPKGFHLLEDQTEGSLPL